MINKEEISANQSVYLDVNQLEYIPPINIIDDLKTKAIDTFQLGEYISNQDSNKLSKNYAPLHNVTFRCQSGQLTALVCTKYGEQRTLLDLISGRRNFGTFNGDIALTGIPTTEKFTHNIAFVPHKTIYNPGLTFLETLRFAAKLRLAHTLEYFQAEERVQEVMKIMDLTRVQNRIVPDFPTSRGEFGRDMRLLSIAMEIIAFPKLILVDDPSLALDAGLATSVYKCLHNLAKRGHIVICAIPKPSPLHIPYFDKILLISEGYSVYNSEISNISPFFCSNQLGYNLKNDVEILDFAIDIASGTERPDTRREAVHPAELQIHFERSKYFVAPAIDTATRSVTVFCDELFYLWGYARIENPITTLIRTFILIGRAITARLKDRESNKRTFASSVLLALITGYLQYGQGNYGYYTMNLVKFPYLGTANTTAYLFMVPCVVFIQQVVNIHVTVQRLQVYRYEQQSDISTSISFFISVLLSDIPIAVAASWILGTGCYFLSTMNYGFYNYFFYNGVLAMIAAIGCGTGWLLTSIFLREVPVRNTYLLCTFLMLILSGFPFQLPTITSYMNNVAKINPIRWAFEATMSWKFNGHYFDGYNYLIPFGSQNFDQNQIFGILGNFIIFSFVFFFVLILPRPMLLSRIPTEAKEKKDDQDVSNSHDSGEIDKFDINFKPPLARPSETQKPLIFARESSISLKSKLSVSISPFADENAQSQRGPTVTFNHLNYRIKDRTSPMGYKTILNNVSGQFDWGKLSMILGPSQSGKSTLLHTLAGDVGVRSDLSGDIFYNHRLIDSNLNLPLWQRCGLVEAHDEQYQDLTVRETIFYAMKLRCITMNGLQSLEENVASTVELLHLGDVLHKKIKQLTRGEKRRVSIAEEIVHGPSLLLIDEPTFDLTTLDESVMMMTFREMVNQDKTVVATVQSPTPASFQLFDSILLLSQGRVIYHGTVSNATNYFISCPSSFTFDDYVTHPGDFLLDIAALHICDKNNNHVDPAVLENYYHHTDHYSNLQRRCRSLYQTHLMKKSSAAAAAVMNNDAVANYTGGVNPMMNSRFGGNSDLDDRVGSFDVETTKENEEEKKEVNRTAVIPSNAVVLLQAAINFFTWKPDDIEKYLFKVVIITDRSFVGLFRSWDTIVRTTLLYIALAVIFGWVIGDCSIQVYNTVSFFAVGPLLLFLCNVQFITYLYKMNEVFLKENSRGLYSNFLHWVHSSIPFYCFQVINAVIYSSIVYKMLNLSYDSDYFRYFVGSMVLGLLASFVMSELVIYSMADIRNSYILIPSVIGFQFLFSGLFIKIGSLPGWLSPWVSSISMIRWLMEGNFINQYEFNTTLFPPVGSFSTYDAFLGLFAWEGEDRFYCAYNMLYFILAFKLATLFVNGIITLYQRGGRHFKKLYPHLS